MWKDNSWFFFFLLATACFFSLIFVFGYKDDTPQVSCTPTQDLSGKETSEAIARFEGKEIRVPPPSHPVAKVLGTSNESRWIEVDLSEQKLRAWEGNNLYLETLISTGLPWWPTPTGEFRIWTKLRYTKMEGGEGKYYYYLPNVPYVMYFENDKIPGWKGYGLHGTYWHSDFGTQRSHGCVNLPTPVAQKLYYWTGPTLGENNSVKVMNDNLGTRIVIHE